MIKISKIYQFKLLNYNNNNYKYKTLQQKYSKLIKIRIKNNNLNSKYNDFFFLKIIKNILFLIYFKNNIKVL